MLDLDMDCQSDGCMFATTKKGMRTQGGRCTCMEKPGARMKLARFITEARSLERGLVTIAGALGCEPTTDSILADIARRLEEELAYRAAIEQDKEIVGEMKHDWPPCFHWNCTGLDECITHDAVPERRLDNADSIAVRADERSKCIAIVKALRDSKPRHDHIVGTQAWSALDDAFKALGGRDP